MSAQKESHRSAVAIAALLSLAMAGCGTALNSSPSTSGTIQPQSQPPSGPILGYVWDAASQALRPVNGVPGASILGTAVVNAPSQGPAFIATASSSVSGMALFLDANGGIFQSPLAGGKLIQIASLPGAEGLTLSNSGAYALVTGKNTSGVNTASVISGLLQSPVTTTLNASAFGTVAGGAASDTGTVVLAAGSAKSGLGPVSLVSFAGKGAGAQVGSLEAFGGMQFVPNSDELVVADAASGAITAISHVNTAPSSASLSAAGGITAPVSLDITPNGRWVVAANHTGDVLRIDLTGAVAATKLQCSCAPNQVLALNGSTAGSTSGTTVHLVTAGAGPVWIVDAGAATPRVMFVPAPSAPTTTTASAAGRPAL